MNVNYDALSKAIAKELASNSELANLKRGTEVKIDFLFQGSAVVKKGEDYQQIVSFALPYDKIVAVLFSKLNNVTMESVVREALDSDLDATDVKAEALKCLASIKGMGKRNMSGKVTIPHVNLNISEVDECEYC